MEAFASFGFEIVTVAGDGPVDRCVPGLAIGASDPPDPVELASVLTDADLVVVENLLTIPMNLPASAGRRPACCAVVPLSCTTTTPRGNASATARSRPCPSTTRSGDT